jgi:hypothetical protein
VLQTRKSNHPYASKAFGRLIANMPVGQMTGSFVLHTIGPQTSTLAMPDNPPFAELPTLDKGRCCRSSELRLPYAEYATKLWG